MKDRTDRLVGRIQERFRTNGSVRTADRTTSRDIAALEARVRRLHALGDSFTHVRLSKDVTQERVARVQARVGGEFVIMDA